MSLPSQRAEDDGRHSELHRLNELQGDERHHNLSRFGGGGKYHCYFCLANLMYYYVSDPSASNLDLQSTRTAQGCLIMFQLAPSVQTTRAS
jgi:hypothetical protein